MGIVNHRKHSDSPDVGDPDLNILMSDWNDAHVLGGGINGQVLTRDDTDPDGAKWTNVRRVRAQGRIASGGTPFAGSTGIVSAVRQGVGVYIVTITPAMPDMNWTLLVTPNGATTPFYAVTNVTSTTTVSVSMFDPTKAANCAFSILVLEPGP